jgi:hypothetical protein
MAFMWRVYVGSGHGTSPKGLELRQTAQSPRPPDEPTSLLEKTRTAAAARGGCPRHRLHRLSKSTPPPWSRIWRDPRSSAIHFKAGLRSTGLRRPSLLAEACLAGIRHRSADAGRRLAGVRRRSAGSGQCPAGVGQRPADVNQGPAGVGQRIADTSRRIAGVGQRFAGAGRRIFDAGQPTLETVPPTFPFSLP